MSLDALSAVSAIAADPSTTTAARPLETGFSALVDQLSGLNQQMGQVEHQVQQVALGNTQNLHEVMMGIEQTRLQFELVMQVRNKLLEGYQELMRMPV
jgi:flagellar hook-basal body complex protein FliE